MVILSTHDLYQVKFSSLVADYDRRTLIDLYMPIVGYAAISIYFAFWAQADKQELGLYNNHEQLLVSMQMATGKFIEERKKLEAIGLLKTTLSKEDDANVYTYSIFAPKTPAKFFSDALLYGLLIKYLGESSASKLRNLYGIDQHDTIGKDISASYAEVFNPDFDSNAFKKALTVKKGEIVDRIQSKVDSEFNFDRFIQAVKSSSQISDAVFTKKVLKEIDRLTALYGINEETAAICFIDCYDEDKPRGERIDLQLLASMFQNEIKYPFLVRPQSNGGTSKISSDSNLAKKINWMEEVSCKDFLQIRQNNTIPVASDLKLVNDLSSKLGLRPGVINAILDFSLAKNRNILYPAYVEKVAASVAREGLTTAYDTMAFLNQSGKRKAPLKAKQTKKAEEKPKNEEFDPEKWEQMLNELGGK